MRSCIFILILFLGPILSCTEPVLETALTVQNLSQSEYLVLRFRPSGEGAFRAHTPLLAPGASHRTTFREHFPETSGCPAAIDVRAYIYSPESLANRDPNHPPIALDAAEFDHLRVCGTRLLGITLVLMNETPPKVQLLYARLSEFEDVLELPTPSPTIDPLGLPEEPNAIPITGRVIYSNGQGLENVGLLLRTRYRETSNDDQICPDDPTGFCFTDPIDFTGTDREGRFEFFRPPGAYMIEPFSDDYCFRPGAIVLESPSQEILILGEDWSEACVSN